MQLEFQNTLKLIKKEKSDLMSEFLEYKAEANRNYKNAKSEGVSLGKSMVREECERRVLYFESSIQDLEESL